MLIIESVIPFYISSITWDLINLQDMTSLMMDLAMVGTGLFDHVGIACQELIRETTLVEPDPVANELYDRYYQVYRALYPALKDGYQLLKEARQED